MRFRSRFYFFTFHVSKSDWAMPHTTGGSQCRQGSCKYAHNHLNDGLPRFLFHSIRLLRVNYLKCEGLSRQTSALRLR